MAASSPLSAESGVESYRVAGELRILELLLINPEHPDVVTALGAKIVVPEAPHEAYVRRTTDPEENPGGW
jgi:hypothetical protein